KRPVQCQRAAQHVVRKDGMREVDNAAARRDPGHHRVAYPHEVVIEAVVGEEDDGARFGTHALSSAVLPPLLATLPTRLLQQLLVLLLPHLLAALLDDRGQASSFRFQVERGESSAGQSICLSPTSVPYRER